MMIYNTTPIKRLKLSFYFLNYGKKMKKPELKQHSNNSAAITQIEKMQTLHEQCKQNFKIL